MGQDELANLILKETAREELSALQEYRRLNLEQHSSTFKWLMASLLAINSGGAIAVLNSEAVEMATKIRAGATFSAGIFFALLVGVISQRAAMKGLPPINHLIGYWLSVVHDGVRDEKIETELARNFSKSIRLAWLGQAIGWMSGFSFFAGLVLIGLGLK
ncbi:MAG: hypothetical protein ACKOPQ_12545 [Novosphingobium sp.]